MYKPSQHHVIRISREWLRATHRKVVRNEPVYILPWLASRDLTTSLLLENNQIEYSRRRRGMGSEVTVNVCRYDRYGRVQLQQDFVVKPGTPVALDISSTSAQFEYGLCRLSEFAQIYVQIVGYRTCALTHGRSTSIMHYRSAFAPVMSAIGRSLRAYRKGFNFLHGGGSYESILVLNLSSVHNLIEIEADYGGEKCTHERIELPPYGSVFVRFDRYATTSDRGTGGFARLKGSAPFDFYVFHTRQIASHELMSIQHVN